MSILIGRQPIFTRSLEVIGYELLYRSAEAPNRAIFVDEDEATLQVVLNAFFEIGVEELVKDRLVFVNLTQNFIFGQYPLPFDPKQTVIEVLEDVQITPQVIAAIAKLVARGFQIALDDVVSMERPLALMPLVHLIKIDIQAIPPGNLDGIVAELRKYNVALLAEKVETQAEFQHCLDLGFSFFQGYFFCKPNIVRQKRMDTARVVVLETLARLESPNVDFTKLEAAIGYDVALSYKLLRLVNSSAYALSSPVSSLRQAIAVLGLNQLRGWMTLLLLSRMGNKPNELAMTALVRARLAEKIAAALALKPVESYFLTGLFSVLDAFLDRPMQEAVQGMPISAEIRDALVTRAGALGEVLNAIMQLEQGDWQPCLNLGMRGDQLNEAFVAAVEYAGVLAKQLES